MKKFKITLKKLRKWKRKMRGFNFKFLKNLFKLNRTRIKYNSLLNKLMNYNN